MEFIATTTKKKARMFVPGVLLFVTGLTIGGVAIYVLVGRTTPEVPTPLTPPSTSAVRPDTCAACPQKAAKPVGVNPTTAEGVAIEPTSKVPGLARTLPMQRAVQQYLGYVSQFGPRTAAELTGKELGDDLIAERLKFIFPEAQTATPPIAMPGSKDVNAQIAAQSQSLDRAALRLYELYAQSLTPTEAAQKAAAEMGEHHLKMLHERYPEAKPPVDAGGKKDAF